jgi:hypothetical protein
MLTGVRCATPGYVVGLLRSPSHNAFTSVPSIALMFVHDSKRARTHRRGALDAIDLVALALFASKEGCCLFVANDFLGFGIPFDDAIQSRGNS